MHILFLADNFTPEVNALASRTFEHCREWVKEGHKVTVITCAPNFPKGKIFKGYKNRLWQKEMIDGIHVIRMWTYITPNEGIYKRTLDYISFMISGALGALFVRKVDIVIGSSPQFFPVCAAWFVGKFKRIPWVFELRDFWPESIKAVGAMKDSWIIKAFEKLEMFLYRQATHIIAVTHTFKKILITRGIDSSKISVVTNGVDLSHFSFLPKDQDLLEILNLKGKFIVGYIGTHGMAHSLETLLEAAFILKHTYNIDNISFLFLGDGACKKELVEKAKEQNLENVIFLDSVSKGEVKRYWSLLDLSIIHLRKADLFKTVIPSKLFESMGMGIPVIHGVPGESAEIVKRYNVGEVFESENAQDIVHLILKLYKDPDVIKIFTENALQAAQYFDRKNLALEMLSVIKKLDKK